MDGLKEDIPKAEKVKKPSQLATGTIIQQVEVVVNEEKVYLTYILTCAHVLLNKYFEGEHKISGKFILCGEMTLNEKT